MQHLRLALLLFAFAGALTGCGQMGGLYHPTAEPTEDAGETQDDTL